MNDAVARLIVFAAIFAFLAIAETLRPRRPRRLPRGQRWLVHAGMMALAMGLVRIIALLLPALGMAAAAHYAGQQGWGLFNQLALSLWLEIALAVVLLDLAIWAQHVATHHIGILWRFHQVHHADIDLDASSALRFHPGEIILSAIYKLLVIMLLGPAVVAVILFEILLNAGAMFNHANWDLPASLDRILRKIIVTPDMHRVHHSIIRGEQLRNFGFCLSVWDRLFGTYQPQPTAGHDGMIIGLAEWQGDHHNRPAQLGWLLKLPFLPEKNRS